MKQELFVVVVVYRGCVQDVHACKSMKEAKAWIREYAKERETSVVDMQEHDYDFSIWKVTCDEKGLWKVEK